MFFRRRVNGNLVEQDTYFYITPDDDYVGVAMIAYGYQRRKGIYPSGKKYSDTVWQVVSPNGSTHSVDFSIIKEGFANLSKTELEDWLKSTLVSMIDRGSVDTAVRRIRMIMNLLQTLIKKQKPIVKADDYACIEDFLAEINVMDIEMQIIESKNTAGTRELPSFLTYLIFDSIIKRFWNENMQIEKRMAYAPLYHYWMICNVLPTRTIEFIGMPVDCTYIDETGHYIKIRKGRIKGSGHKTQNVYHLDHPIGKFATQSRIVKMLNDYKIANIGHEYKVSEQDMRLYSTYWYDLYFGTKSNEMFTTKTMQKLLGRFYTEVIQDEYGYHIIDFDKEPNLDKKEITQWHLYDLRHLAIINMTYRGVDPAYITKYSGHTDPAEFTHYACNIGSITKSWVHYMMHYQDPSFASEVKRLQSASPDYYVPVKDGICLNRLPWEAKGPVCAKHEDCKSCKDWQPNKRYDLKMEENKVVKKANQMMELYLGLLAAGNKETATEALRQAQTHIREIIKAEIKMTERTA